MEPVEKRVTKRKKMTLAQKEKRTKLLEERVLDKWFYSYYGDEDDENNIVFVKNRLQKDGSNSIEQIIISNNFYADGLYVIQDYDIDEITDLKTGKSIIKFSQKQFDKTIGKNAGKDGKVSNMNQLKQKLLERGLITEEELKIFAKKNKKTTNLDEILLD